jgi:DNA polymerase-3 subunit alpha
VFQFESIGMQRMLKDAKPDRLEDLIALNALYRPGPMDLIPTYIARKQGKEVPEYPHPRVKAILEETYGIMVYQEQVMQTAQILGGYSLGGADLLRRAMGKKKLEEMDEHREIFRKGAARAARAGEGRRGIRLDGEVRGLRLQQVARCRLCAAGVPHGLAQGALHGRILRRQHDGGNGRHRQAQALVRRRAEEWASVRVARREPRRLPLRAHQRDLGALRPGRHQGHGPAGDRRRSCAARKEGGPFTSFDFCVRVDRSRLNKRTVEASSRAAHSTTCSSTAPRCWRRWTGPSTSPSATGQRQPGRAVRHVRLARRPARRSRRWSRPCPGA